MAEAGADEITEAEILDALDIAHAEIKRLCEKQHELRRAAGKREARGQSSAGGRVGAERGEGALRRRAGRGHADRRQARKDRSRRSASRRRRSQRWRGTRGSRGPATRAAPRRSLARQAPEGHHPAPHRGRQEAPRRRAADELRDIWVEVGVAPAPTAPRSSRAVRRSPVAALGTTRDEMRLRHARLCRRPSTTSTTTTFRRSRWRRRASCAAPSAATSATERSPSGRSCRSCRESTSSRTRSAWSRTSSSRTALPRWRPLCGSTLSLMDAGVPIKAPVGGVAMGLIKEGDDYVSCSPTSPAWRITSAIWTSRSPAPPTGSPLSRWTSRSRA